VFLDIPHPWEAVPHAAATFKDVGKWNCACWFKGQLVDYGTCHQRDCHLCLVVTWYSEVYTQMHCCMQRCEIGVGRNFGRSRSR
jgi:hypothetical protein